MRHGFILFLLAALAACSGGGGGGESKGTVVGAAGGTVIGPNGAAVVIPPGALTAATTIHIAQSAEGAPPLPTELTPVGETFAFTPRGTSFAVPVSVTVPFAAAQLTSGQTPLLYKTNAAQSGWELVENTTINASSVLGQVSGFSYFRVVRKSPLSRFWDFIQHSAGDTTGDGQVFARGDANDGAILFERRDFGPLAFAPAGHDLTATGEVYSSATGRTYWVEAEAPLGNVSHPSDIVGGETRFIQYQVFRKDEAGATLNYKITQAQIEAIDSNGALPVFGECPWAEGQGPAEICKDEVFGEVGLEIVAVIYSYPPGVQPSELNIPEPFDIHEAHQGSVRLWGWQENWKWQAHANAISEVRFSTSTGTDVDIKEVIPIFAPKQIAFATDGTTTVPETGAAAHLTGPVTVNIDLSRLPIGTVFYVETVATALAHNRRGNESFITARLRDPAQTDGLGWVATGVTVLDPGSVTRGPVVAPEPVCAAAGVDAESGTLQFSEGTYALPEFRHTSGGVLVTRTGGSKGKVIAQVTTGGGSALPGTHYTPVTQTVVFGDGDTVPRTVDIPIVNNTLFSGPTTIELTLTPVGNCAKLGTRSTAVATLLDDETPRSATLTVGGTVSGLAGSGLVLEEVKSGPQLTPGNGSFVFNRAYNNSADYEVRIVSQPRNPSQICSVANPSGTIANANVTNVAVTCTTPAANGALDSGFGSGGKVRSALVSSVSGNVARAVALQSTGKIVVLANMALVRFHPDGSVDESFGGGGVVPVVFADTLNNETSDLVIDANDRIIVAGWTRASNTTLNYDFAINRYDAHGNLDSSFDGDGKVTIDFYGELDRAHRVALDNSGRILVSGQTSYLLPPPNPLGEGNTSFVVTRLNVDGTRDKGFLTARAFADYSIPYALALSPAGKIMLGGSAAANGTAESNAALARFGTDSQLDSDQDSDPTVWFGVDASGKGADDLLYGVNDQIVDLVITGSDRIWGAVRTPNTNMSNTYTGANSKYNFLLVEFEHDFGDTTAQGPGIRFTEVPIGPGDDRVNALALQSDGKLVLVGGASNTASIHTDFGVVRFDANGAVDTTFGTNGVVAIDFLGGVDEAKDIVVQPDGKLVVVGTIRNGSSWNLGLARIVP